MTEWRNEYMCQFADDSSHLRLRELVIDYLDETDEYDAKITGRADGMTNDSTLRLMMSRHAAECHRKLVAIAKEEGVYSHVRWIEIRDQEQRYRDHA